MCFSLWRHLSKVFFFSCIWCVDVLADEQMGSYLCWLYGLARCVPWLRWVYPPTSCSSHSDGSKSTSRFISAMQTQWPLIKTCNEHIKANQQSQKVHIKIVIVRLEITHQSCFSLFWFCTSVKWIWVSAFSFKGAWGCSLQWAVQSWFNSDCSPRSFKVLEQKPRNTKFLSSDNEKFVPGHCYDCLGSAWKWRNLN